MKTVTWRTVYMFTCPICLKKYEAGKSHECNITIIDAVAYDIVFELPAVSIGDFATPPPKQNPIPCPECGGTVTHLAKCKHISC